MSDQSKEPVQNNNKKHLVLIITASIIIGSGVTAGIVFATFNTQSDKGIPSLVNCDAENQSPNCVPVPINSVEKMDKETFEKCTNLLIDIVSVIPPGKGINDNLDLDKTSQKLFDESMFEWNQFNCISIESLITDTMMWKHRND